MLHLLPLHEKFNPRNIKHMSPVKFLMRLDLDLIFLFLDGHYLAAQFPYNRPAVSKMVEIIPYDQ